MTATLQAKAVRDWGHRYSNWGRWGDERGTLDFITPERHLDFLCPPLRSC